MWLKSCKVFIYVLFFHAKHKKKTFLAVLTWFPTLGKIQDCGQDGDHCWWRHRPPAAPPPTKYTSSCEEDQRLSTKGKIVSKYCNISKTPGWGSIHPPPPPCTTVGVWICLYVRWLILIVWPRSVVTLRVLSSGSVLVLHFQKAPDNSKLISSSSILSIALLSLAEGGSKLSSLRIQPFLIHSFPAQWMDVSAERFRRPLYSQATNYWRSEKLRRIDWWQVSVPQDTPLSVLFLVTVNFGSLSNQKTQVVPLFNKIGIVISSLPSVYG